MFVLFAYTEYVMKQSSRVPIKKATTSRVTQRATRREGSLSRAARATRRYGKQTLRDILLSKTFHSTFKVTVGLMIAGSALYGSYALIESRVANDVVVSKSEIIARIGKHIALPDEEPEALVRVQDAEALKKQVALYENVKEGDYILIYPSLAVVYDLRKDHIIALKSTRK